MIPILNLCWITLVILGIFTINSLWIPVIVSLSIVGSHLKTINKAHSLLSKIAGTLKGYTTIIRLMETERFQSGYLIRLQGKLSSHGMKAGDSLTSLYKLLNSFDQRLNVLVSIVLNALLLYDIQIWLRLGKWKARHKSKVLSRFEALADLEMRYSDIVVNKCFEVELTDDQLIFDYKLKDGISQKLNASYLMKKMGIID